MSIFSFLRRKENPVNKNIIAMVGGADAVYTPRDYKSLAVEGYQNCATAYSCVKLISTTASRIKWIVYRMDAAGNMDEFMRHPLLDLLNRPNEVEGGKMFTEKIISHLLLQGNAYVQGVRGTQSGPPRFLYTMRPDYVKVLTDKSGKFLVSGYRFTGMYPQDFPAEDVMHLWEFHPTNDFYGLSRIEVAAREVDSMNEAADWNLKTIQNDMRPPGIITASSTFDLEKFKSMWKENYQGGENAGKPIVLTGNDIEWQSLGITPKDADWLKGQQFNLRQICSIFGVDPSLVGDSEYATYSNKQEARKGLYQETVLPLMDLLRDEYQRWLVPFFGQGITLDYDRNGIEELREDEEKKFNYLKVASWLTINEKRLACGYDEIDGGDELDKPAPPAAFGQQPAPAKEPPPAPAKSRQTKSVWREPEQAKALWTAFDTRAAKRAKSYLELARVYLKGQAQRVRDRVESAASIHTVRHEHLLIVADEAKAYADHFWPWYRDHYGRAKEAGKRAAKGEVFDDAETKASWTTTMTPEQERRLREAVFNSGTKVNQTTVEMIYGQLLEAQKQNKTVAEFASDIYEYVSDFTYGRATTWSATESCKTDNMGQLDGMKETEMVTGKGWLCSFLPTSRPDHEEASGQEVGLYEQFKVGPDYLDFPGDPKGEAGEVVNCRCSIYPTVE